MLEALVAGAGPAGGTAALLLARAKKSVCIFERSAFPRTKVCGEYLSAGCVRLLRELGIDAALTAHARPVRGVRLHGHGVHARIDFTRPGWSLPRSVLDAALLDAAVEAGARVVQARVEGCDDGEHAARLCARVPDGSIQEVEARAVVGADGIHSIIARKCGLAAAQNGAARFALGGHYRGFRALDEYIDMFVDGHSYVAINPLDEQSANVMLVVDERELHARSGDVEAFAEERARGLAGTLLEDAKLDGKRIAIGPLAYRAQRLAGRRVLLAGDAACFLNPFTGQGVYLAMRCARLAAECILADRLRSYAALASREIAARERAAQRVARIIESPALARVTAAIFPRASWMLRPLVERVTGAA